MVRWWKRSGNDGYVNSSLVSVLQPSGSGSNWRIHADGYELEAGPSASEAEASEAIRKLVQGLDPSTIV